MHLRAERSGHGGNQLFDSFSESYHGGEASLNSSWQGGLASALPALQHPLLARCELFHGSVAHVSTKSVDSGTEFYEALQRGRHLCKSTAVAARSIASTVGAGDASDAVWSQETTPISFDFLQPVRSAIQPRWAHSAAAVGDRMYIYGGLAAADRPLSSIHVYSLGALQS